MSTSKINSSVELVKEIQTEVKFHLERLNEKGIHLTQEGIAEYLGITQSNVSRILNSSEISVEKVIYLALGLGVEIDIRVNSKINHQKNRDIRFCMEKIKDIKKLKSNYKR
ncbi:XRE family transcriptional regulator [Vibrio alginolyticus]|nr:XRE family transcriptional regulator [Vibrio alginolyticus]